MKRVEMLVISKSWLLLFVMLLSVTVSNSQDNLDMQRILKPVDSSNIFVSDSFYNWCSTVIKAEDGKYHMFYSRWPHGKRVLDDDSMNHIFDGFRGWNKYSEIASAVSDKLEGPYKYVATVLKGDHDPKSWQRFTMHNPQVRKFGDYYYLYYISNSFDSSLRFTNESGIRRDWKHWLQYNCTQKIGVIKAKTIAELVAGKFQKCEQPIMWPDNKNTFEVTTNPTVTQGPDGRYYMMYKSRKPNVGNMTFWMAVSDRPDGDFKMLGEVFTSSDMACEDPCLWYDKNRKRFYAAAKYYSNSKVLSPQFGSLVLITSVDGIKWTPAKHSLISLRELKRTDGSVTTLAHLERPFVVTDKKGQPVALFAAASMDEPSKGNTMQLDSRLNTFIVAIPLKK